MGVLSSPATSRRNRRSLAGLPRSWAVLSVIPLLAGLGTAAGADRLVERFDQQVRPILEDHCFACHGNGSKKGGLAFDGFASDEELVRDRRLWWAVLKNVRAGLMPPAEEPRPSDEERRALEDWIKAGVFG